MNPISRHRCRAARYAQTNTHTNFHYVSHGECFMRKIWFRENVVVEVIGLIQSQQNSNRMKEAAVPGFLCASQHISRRNPDAKSLVNGSRMIRDFMLCCFVCCSTEREQMRRRLMRCESLSGQMSFLWELSGSNVARESLMWSFKNFIVCKESLFAVKE